MKDAILRLGPVAIPIAGFVLALLGEALTGKRALIAVASLVAALGSLLTGAPQLGGYGSEIFQLDLPGEILCGAALAFTLATLAHSAGYLSAAEDETPAERAALVLLVPAGVALVVGARHLLLVFLGIELLSIPLYALVAMRRRRDASIEGAVKYFLLGAFAAGFLAYGLSLLYAAEGTLDVAKLAGASGRSLAGATGAAFVLLGLLFKVSAAPFHFWTPDAYEGAATPITGLMASATKVAAVAGLLIVMPILPAGSAPVLGALAVLTIAAGNLGALMQERVKRMLAYSAVAHAGTILLALAAERAASTTPIAADLARASRHAATFYLVGYGASALGAFGCLAILERGGDRFRNLADFRGLARKRPALAALLAFFLLSLGGIPPTGGFWAKYFVFAAAVRADLIALSVVAIVLSVLGVAYYLRIVAACFMGAEESGAATETPRSGSTWAAWAATWLAAAAVLWLGLMPSAG